MVQPQATRCVCVLLALVLGAGCSRRFEGGGDLRAQKKVLEREVAGLSEAVARLERGEAVLPKQDLAVAIDETLVQGLISAQMPFEATIKEFQLTLQQAEVTFRGAPAVKLKGRLFRSGRVDLEAVVNVIGALDRIEVDAERATLAARIAVDHIGIEKAAGMEALLTGSALDEAARLIRLQLADQLPPIQIPVKVQQSIELPAVTTGPVRLHGARLPITAGVSQVFAGQGRLWIAIHFQPGEFTKTTEAPQVADSRAQDVETGFDAPAGDASQTPKGDTKPKPNTAPKQKQPPKAEPRGSAQGGGR